jgi:hypothetical protein
VRLPVRYEYSIFPHAPPHSVRHQIMRLPSCISPSHHIAPLAHTVWRGRPGILMIVFDIEYFTIYIVGITIYIVGITMSI